MIFCLTRLRVKTSDGDSVVSMQVNKCEDRKDEYEFSQTCIGFDDVAYHLKKNDIISAEGEYNTDVDTLYITCKLKNSLTVSLMIINVSGSENRTDEYDEMDVYQLNDFLEDVLHEKNEYYCVFTRITDVFGFDLKMRNCIRTYINTLDDSDWKLHISDDFTSFEVPERMILSMKSMLRIMQTPDQSLSSHIISRSWRLICCSLRDTINNCNRKL